MFDIEMHIIMSKEEDLKKKAAEHTTQAQSIIYDVWGSSVSWKTLDESLSNERIISIQPIPLFNGSLALDMRIRLDTAVTESELIFRLMAKYKDFMLKMLADSTLSEYSEIQYEFINALILLRLQAENFLSLCYYS